MSQIKETSNQRRNDLDWLRVAAVMLLIPFHASLIFVADPNSIMYVKDSVYSLFLGRMAGYIHQFHMPLLFFIAGASSFFALAFRSPAIYLQERVKRLLVPALFTTLVLVPPMTYISRLSQGEKLTFWQHYAGFFKFNPADLTGLTGTLTPAHSWFILYLVLFSLIALPLFLMVRKNLNNLSNNKLAAFFEKPFALYLLLIPVAVTASIDLLGDKNPIYYFGIFILGFLLMTDNRYQKAIDREAPISLILGTAFFITRVLWHPTLSEWSLAWIGYGLMEQATRLFLLFGILGLGHRAIHRGGKVLAYLSKAAFPFYLLHLLITTVIGFFIIRLDVGIAVKYLLIITLSTLATFGVYEVLKRIPVFRFLLGIKK
jgi:glucans biosynthesis protein C